jgi:uncharacterized protein (DUF983 family)
MNPSTVWSGIRRGLSRRCPSCGQGSLFDGLLTVRPNCDFCIADNAAYPSDDMPPYVTMVIVGHIVLPLLLWVDHVFTPPIGAQFAIWLPITALLSVALLPFVKGGVVGLCWATGTVRHDAH